MGKTSCALFLSLRYHNLKPDYINERIKQLGKLYELRVLLVQVRPSVVLNTKIPGMQNMAEPGSPVDLGN